jgi:hypothetical protein
MFDNNFLWLLKWYKSHCNGDWEHGRGIHLDTIDNPGWSLSINLEDTEGKCKGSVQRVRPGILQISSPLF